MDTLNFAHQANLFDPRNARKVIVIGAGSVGSWLVEFLARMGVSDIEVWDGDVVNSYNLPMSRYRLQDIGRYKVEALKDILLESTGVAITPHARMYQGKADFRNATIVSCVDSMEARKLIWKQVKKHRLSVDIFCDTRLADAYVEVLSIAPCDARDVRRYEATLFSDSEAVRQTCGRHGIAYATTRAAGIVASTLAGFWTARTKQWLVQERCDILRMVA